MKVGKRQTKHNKNTQLKEEKKPDRVRGEILTTQLIARIIFSQLTVEIHLKLKHKYTQKVNSSENVCKRRLAQITQKPILQQQQKEISMYTTVGLLQHLWLLYWCGTWDGNSGCFNSISGGGRGDKYCIRTR